MANLDDIIKLTKANVANIRRHLAKVEGDNLQAMMEVLRTPLPRGVTTYLDVIELFRDLGIMEWTDWDPWSLCKLPSDVAEYKPRMPSVRVFLEANGPAFNSFTNDELRVIEKMQDLKLVHVGRLLLPKPNVPNETDENEELIHPPPPEENARLRRGNGRIKAYLSSKTCSTCGRQPKPWDTYVYASTTCVGALREERRNENGTVRVRTCWAQPHLLCERCKLKDQGFCSVFFCRRPRGRQNIREIALPEKYIIKVREKRERMQAEQRTQRVRLRRARGHPRVTRDQMEKDIRMADDALREEQTQARKAKVDQRTMIRTAALLREKYRQMLRNKWKYRGGNMRTCRECWKVFTSVSKKYAHYYKTHNPKALKKRLKDKSCDAPTCQYVARDWRDLENHQKAKRCPFRREWKCQRCLKNQRSRTDWLRHAKVCLRHGDHCGLVKVVDCTKRLGQEVVY